MATSRSLTNGGMNASATWHRGTALESRPKLGTTCRLSSRVSSNASWRTKVVLLGLFLAMAAQPVLGKLSIDGLPLPMAFDVSNHALFLFEDWPTVTQGEFVLACIGTCVFGFVSIILKVIRRYVERDLVAKEDAGKTKLLFGCFPVYANSVRFVVAFVSYTWDYMLMLLAMTFNVGIFLSMLLGFALGFLFLGDLLSIDVPRPFKACMCEHPPTARCQGGIASAEMKTAQHVEKFAASNSGEGSTRAAKTLDTEQTQESSVPTSP
ncbi:Ctr copper transporter family protein [Besnoitia besnoiti]|uniref:Copper transport protein n=1 Tax=Besnoitia besnoiti TaxID=94643 RepID=A0A2A9MNI0_BESBE|nr:Ctr copper transporter family protein [Besnoitia besnoiti]PFH38101.1 Ctr copper transporter family protein [Besnoitia besnoiti]